MSTIAATNLKNASSGSNNIVLNTDGTIGGTCLTQTCRAWVNFNGTSTVAIRASYNVSSITDNGTGDYTVNFTTALADANYCVNALVNTSSTSDRTGRIGPFGNGSETALSSTYSTTAVQLKSFNEASAALDKFLVSVAIFR